MSELYSKQIVPVKTLMDFFEVGNTLVRPRIIGGMAENMSFASASSGARIEIFPDNDPTVGIVVYDDAESIVFKTVVSGADVGDVIIGDYDSGQGIKYDKSAGTISYAGVSSTKTFYQTTVPTAENAGDLWFDTDDGNKPYRATATGDDAVTAGEWEAVNNPTEWVDVADGASTKPDDSATVGATAGTDLVNEASSVLYDVNVVKLLQTFYGSGGDGDITVSSNTSLTSDMYYNNLTVNNGVTLNPNGYRIFVKETLTNNGTISRNGGNGGTGSAGANVGAGDDDGGAGGAGGNAIGAIGAGSIEGAIGGPAGGAGGAGDDKTSGDTGSAGSGGGGGSSVAKAYSGDGVDGSTGGAGGDSADGSSHFYTGYAGGAGGNKGTSTGTIYNIPVSYSNAVWLYDVYPSGDHIRSSAGSGAGGGGGGGRAGRDVSSNYYAGGGGGGGGGSGGAGAIVFVSAKIVVNNGTISANGGAGGAGGVGGDAFISSYAGGGGGGGGGSGGSGGIMIFVYNEKTGSNPTASAGSAGSGGGGGSGGNYGNPYSEDGSDGETGSAGGDGKVIMMQT